MRREVKIYIHRPELIDLQVHVYHGSMFTGKNSYNWDQVRPRESERNLIGGATISSGAMMYAGHFMVDVANSTWDQHLEDCLSLFEVKPWRQVVRKVLKVVLTLRVV